MFGGCESMNTIINQMTINSVALSDYIQLYNNIQGIWKVFKYAFWKLLSTEIKGLLWLIFQKI